MIVGDRLGDILQQHRLADARRRDDQRALTLALRTDKVDDPRRLVLDRRFDRVERPLLVGIERGEIVDIDAVSDELGVVEIDADQLGKSSAERRGGKECVSTYRSCGTPYHINNNIVDIKTLTLTNTR